MEPAPELNFLAALLPLVVIVFIIAIGVVMLNQHFRKNLYKQMLEKEELEKKYHYDLLCSSIEVQEVERKRIAHDLHDEIGALLTTSRMYFNQLSTGQAEERLEQVSNKMNFLFDEMMFNIRRISHDLRPVVLENLGLVQAIEAFAEKLVESGMSFDFTHDIPFQITPKAELVLYRIIQELVGNTLKHSGAGTITLDMQEQGSRFIVQYSDDGKGFAPQKGKHGLGIKSIESRLKLINGKMNVETAVGEGVRFTLDIDVLKLTHDE
jgi:signal transduction histidine kinase